MQRSTHTSRVFHELFHLHSCTLGLPLPHFIISVSCAHTVQHVDCPWILNLITDEWIGSYSDPQYVHYDYNLSIILRVLTDCEVSFGVIDNHFGSVVMRQF